MDDREDMIQDRPVDSRDARRCYQLWRIWTTLKQMCYDRGYLVTQEQLSMSLERWKEEFGDRPSDNNPSKRSLAFSAPHVNDPSDQILVDFPDEDDVNTRTIKELYERMRDSSIHKAIVVVGHKIAPIAVRAIGDLKQHDPPYVIQPFREEDLLVNITRHELVPRHEVLTAEEKKILLERYNLSDHNLPKIQENDPITRYFGLSKGQVFRIVRRSETAGRYVTYRIVWSI